ncbi:hypothetical protein NAEGRDRAFT_79172 [Naegleria gruberi]|uniref:Uncharacterized protein n=1 Tax=Naegleria gruberi TaxID=5762 RepID=D2VA41_NAEGR|nr:uncharacterized protein NAEGRDRAFT_79172 [Naegleria gruberi]EFC46362.1 hypothetical protein NAEGRDRAFT_79172 [Naegleria gruberi]|eukprot:XP_002679106.1 hypothetical protein NAEGRDRAFT_79172 [Naegleria gruberi strain NEG-M]
MSGGTAQQLSTTDEYQSTKSFNFFVKDPKVKIFSSIENSVSAATPQKKERKQKVVDDNNSSGSSNNQVGGSNCLLDSEASGSLGKNSTSVQSRKVGEHHLSHWFLKKEEPKKNKVDPQRGITKKKRKKQMVDVSNVLLSKPIMEQSSVVFQPIQTPPQQPSVLSQQHYATNVYNAGSQSYHNVIQPSYQHSNVDNNAPRGFVPYTHQYQRCSTQNNMITSPPVDPTPYNGPYSPPNYSRVSSPEQRFDGVSGRPCYDNIGPYCHSPLSNSTCSQKQFPEPTKVPSPIQQCVSRIAPPPFGGIFEKPFETLPPLSALLTTPPERSTLDLYAKPQPANVLPSLSCLLYNKPEQ